MGINPNKGWVSVGASGIEPHDFNGRSFGGPYVWAIGFNNNFYPSESARSDGNIQECDSYEHFRLTHVEIDVLVDLDAEKPVLRIGKVDDQETVPEAKLWNKPERVDLWLPYFNMYYDGAG